MLRPYHDETSHQVEAVSLIRYVLGLPISVAVIGVASQAQLQANVRVVRETTPMSLAEQRSLERLVG